MAILNIVINGYCLFVFVRNKKVRSLDFFLVGVQVSIGFFFSGIVSLLNIVWSSIFSAAWLRAFWYNYIRKDFFLSRMDGLEQ